MGASRKKKPVAPRLPALPRTQLYLALVASDATFTRSALGPAAGGQTVWSGKCIHCRAALWVDARGNPGPGVTLEHIVPSGLGGTGACDNLALACARCNQQKGSRLDALGLDHPRLRAVIELLQARRRERWRTAPSGLVLSEAAQRYLADGAPRA